MAIKRLRIDLSPEPTLGDVYGLRWEVYEDDGILGYRKMFSATEVTKSNDWKSHWDYMWEIAKREFEKAQENKATPTLTEREER